MKEKIIIRYIVVYLSIIALAFSIFGKGFYVSTIERGSWIEKSDKQRKSRVKVIPANRGDIRAEDGRILATSVPYYELRFDVYAISDTLFTRKLDSLSLCLSRLFHDKSASEYRRMLLSLRRRKSRYALIGPRKINHIELKQVMEFPIFRAGKYKGGLITVQSDERIQPHKNLGSRTIGALKKGLDDTWEGYVGIEQAYEQYLKGEPGSGHLQNMSGFDRLVVDKKPRHGFDVITTLDVDIQDVVQSALHDQLVYSDADKGVAIVMDVKTGDIKAMSNLTRFAEGNYYETINYAISYSEEPGSVIKTATILSMLEDGVATPKDTFDLGDKPFYRFHGATVSESGRKAMGKVSLQQILERSSNGITKVTDSLYKRHPQDLVNRFYQIGLNEKLGISLLGEGAPVIKHPSQKDWSGITLPWMAMGYEIQLTPLQILAFYNAIANGGQRMRPRFVKEIRDGSKVIESFGTEEVGSRICSRSTVKILNTMLKGVVERGTAKGINTSRYAIAGKTGTARVSGGKNGYLQGRYRSTFVGYFPADKPQYSCFVMIENARNGYYAAATAAPVFRKISDQIYIENYDVADLKESDVEGSMPISKDGSRNDLMEIYDELDINVEGDDFFHPSEWIVTHSNESDAIQIAPKKIVDGVMPNVKGMGLRDVLYLLENMGLRVHAEGKGHVVEQSIAAGSSYRDGSMVYLRLRL